MGFFFNQGSTIISVSLRHLPIHLFLFSQSYFCTHIYIDIYICTCIYKHNPQRAPKFAEAIVKLFQFCFCLFLFSWMSSISKFLDLYCCCCFLRCGDRRPTDLVPVSLTLIAVLSSRTVEQKHLVPSQIQICTYRYRYTYIPLHTLVTTALDESRTSFEL